MYYLHISVFLVVIGQLVVLTAMELLLMTSSPSTSPLVNIIQGHFRKSLEALVKILGCGWWLNMNAVTCWPWWRSLLCWRVVTDLKLAKLGWNKIGSQNTFLQYIFRFCPFSSIPWTLNMAYVFKHLEVYMKTQFLCCFMIKWLGIIVGAFNSSIAEIES